MLKPFYISIFLTTCWLFSFGQKDLERIINMQSAPKVYAIAKTQQPILIDGLASEPIWDIAPWSEDFVDIEGNLKPHPLFTTQVKMLWDDEYLYIYARLEEPHIWGNLTEHDAIIYHNNDFEVFLKPSEQQSLYYEIEVNTLNTVMDLMMAKPYRIGGEAIMHWDVKNLKSAVHIGGTLNDPSDTDQYWSIEMAIPFKSLSTFGRKSTPDPNDFWRINFSRVQWQHVLQNGKYERKKEHGKLVPEENWVWSPIGIVNMHYPERWGYIQFVESPTTRALPKSHDIEQLAWNIFYLQQLYFNNGNKYSHKIELLPGFEKTLKSKTKKIQHTITNNKSRTFYKVELNDTDQRIQATIDNFGNYSIHYYE